MSGQWLLRRGRRIDVCTDNVQVGESIYDRRFVKTRAILLVYIFYMASLYFTKFAFCFLFFTLSFITSIHCYFLRTERGDVDSGKEHMNLRAYDQTNTNFFGHFRSFYYIKYVV